MRYIAIAVAAVILACGLASTHAAAAKKSPAQIAEVSKELAEKTETCRLEAKAQKLHLSKRHAFMRNCMNR